MGEIPRGPEPASGNPEGVEGRKALYGRLSTAWHHAKEGLPIPGWVALDVDPSTVSIKPTGGSDQFVITHTRTVAGVNGVSVTHIRVPVDTDEGFEGRETGFTARKDGAYEGPGTIVTRPYIWDEQAERYVTLVPRIQTFSMDDPKELTALGDMLPEVPAHDSSGG